MKRMMLCACLFCMLGAQAQVTPIDSVKITASRIELPIEQAGRSVSVITQQELSAMPVSSLDEMFRYISGVHLNQRGAFGVQSDISMRGSTFSQVLIMIDNIRVNDPLTAHFNHQIPVTLAEIERIEIIRGPAAASYGADAVGGMIHIITKTYARSFGDNANQTNGSLAVGSHRSAIGEVGIYQSRDKFRFSAGARSAFAAGQEYANPNFPDPAANKKYRNFFDIKSLSSSMAFTPNKSFKVYARMGADSRRFSAKYFYTASAYDESIEQVDVFWSQASIQKNWKKQKSSLNLGYRNSSDHFAFNPAFAANDHTTEMYSANLNHYLKIKDLKLVFGNQTEYRSMISSDRGNRTNLNSGFYVVGNHEFKKLSSNASLRYEYNEFFDWEFVPQLSLAYGTKKHTVRASVGKGIRAADFTERYVSTNLASISPGRNIGNPNLAAERSWNSEIGYDYKSKIVNASVTGFMRVSEGLIDYISTKGANIPGLELVQDADYLYAQNISETSTSGVEIELQKDWKISEHAKIHGRLGYTFLNTSNKDSVVSKYIANHPIHNVSLSTFFQSKHVFVSLNANQVMRDQEQLLAIDAEIPSQYLLMNLKLGWRISSLDLKFMPFIQVNNALNTSYQEILGAQMPGRWILFGFEKPLF